MAQRYVSRLRQKTLIYVYAKLLRISNMMQSGVAPATFWLILTKPSLSCLGKTTYIRVARYHHRTFPWSRSSTCNFRQGPRSHTWLEPDLQWPYRFTLISSLLSTLVQINGVRHLFSTDVLYTILNSLVFRKLFYCSTVWSGTSKENIHKLQLTKNFTGRILTNTKKLDDITPVLSKSYYAYVM